MYYVYILQSKVTGGYYIGSCANISVRLRKHNMGHVRSTKAYLPWQVVYSETLISRKKAYRRELQIKSYKGGNSFKALIAK